VVLPKIWGGFDITVPRTNWDPVNLIVSVSGTEHCKEAYVQLMPGSPIPLPTNAVAVATSCQTTTRRSATHEYGKRWESTVTLLPIY
jgi:hypothetical protein